MIEFIFKAVFFIAGISFIFFIFVFGLFYIISELFETIINCFSSSNVKYTNTTTHKKTYNSNDYQKRGNTFSSINSIDSHNDSHKTVYGYQIATETDDYITDYEGNFYYKTISGSDAYGNLSVTDQKGNMHTVYDYNNNSNYYNNNSSNNDYYGSYSDNSNDYYSNNNDYYYYYYSNDDSSSDDYYSSTDDYFTSNDDYFK